MARRFHRSARGRPRRRGLRPPIAPVRWEAANFFFDSAVQLAHGVFTVNSLSLLQIPGHAGASTQGRVLEGMSRRIELGGIVWNYWFNHIGAADQIEAQGDGWARGHFLVIDRLDITGQPEALPDWTLSNAPIATAPGAANEEVDFPTRILFRDCDFRAGMAGLVATPRDLVNASRTHPGRTHSVRIRRFLDDDHGLFLQFYNLFNAADAEGNFDVEFGAWGTVYYRWKFG